MSRSSGGLVSLMLLLVCSVLSHPVEGQAAPDAVSSLDVPVTIPLESYAGTVLRKVKVVIAGDTLDFLIDTGGGVTLISPSLAEALGCTPGGRAHGYRMSGDELEWKTCPDVPLEMGDFRTTVEAGVFDLMPLIGSNAPVVHGMISLQTFAGHTLTLHAGGGGVTIETPQSLEARVRDATPLRARLATGLEGAELTAYIGIPGKDADYWFLWDSGNNGPVHIASWAAAALGITDTTSTVEFPLPLAPGLDVVVPVRRRQIIHDGVLSAGLISRATWTIDLVHGRMWISSFAGR